MFKINLDVHDAFFESFNAEYFTKKLALRIDNETMKLSSVQVSDSENLSLISINSSWPGR